MSGKRLGGAGVSTTPPMSLDVFFNEQANFVKPYVEYQCGLCKNILLDPHQTSCGHRLCKQCLTKHFAANGDPSLCPFGEDDCEMISVSDKTVYPDFVLRRELKKLEVYCDYRAQGCQEIVTWGTLQKHKEKCEFGKVSCPYQAHGCTEKMISEQIQAHKEICNFQPQTCSHCQSQNIPRIMMQEHLETTCPMVEVPCPNNCGQENIMRGELDEHANRCPKKPRECRHKVIGCRFKAPSEKLAEHEKDSMVHLEVCGQQILRLERRIADQEARCQELESESDLTTTRLKKVSEAHAHLDQSLRRTENRLRETQKVSAQQQERIMALEQSVLETKIGPQLNQLQSRMSALENKDGTAHAQQLVDIDLRMQVLETASYNGMLIWKIRDYSTRRQDARSGGILSLYSQPFYTSRHGYKMCARVYLNGDGMGKDTHLSLFFVVMRGEFDALLPWPFRQKVNLMLMDQVGGMRHLSDTFKPDPSSSSFQRPRSDMNVASGCPLFVSHNVLEAKDSLYLQDDTLFIKIVIDTSGLASV